LHAGQPLVSFDNWLLAAACQSGASHVNARVRHVRLENGRPVVHTDGGSFPADLLVLATGVNSRPPLDEAFGYTAPKTLAMVQDEVLRPAQWPDSVVAGFFGQPSGLVFGAMVPKDDYLNVSLLWPAAGAGAVERFYQAQRGSLTDLFPDGPVSRCGCNPRIVVRPASRFCGERWVAVGDAAVARIYKDGINSAFLTAEAAMRCALDHGISGKDLLAGYGPYVRHVAHDNAYGFALFGLASRALRLPNLAMAWMACMQSESDLPVNRRLQSRIMWGVLTGDEPYQTLFRLMFQPRGLARLAAKLAATRRSTP
jgi:flavin-dependent dehydrogenase